jgi:hypothetical protein
MGKIGKAFGKILEVVKPFVSAINPALGAAMGFVGGLLQGKNPLQAALGAVTDLIPGGAGGILKNVLGKFAGPALGSMFDGLGGNSLLKGALDAVTGKGKVTDILGDVMKNVAGKGLTDLGLKNIQELGASSIAQSLLS